MSREFFSLRSIIAEFRRIVYMADSIVCCCFLCESCEWPNSLPLDTIRQRVQYQAGQPNDYPSVAFVCWRCMNIQIRSLDPDSPYNRASDTKVLTDLIEDAAFVVWLPTCEENCEFQIPLFVTWNMNTDVKSNDKWFRDRPQEVNLRCPNGHLIHWGWNGSEKTT
jgi:hypothetical protein